MKSITRLGFAVILAAGVGVLAVPARAAGRVEAIAGPVSDVQDGPAAVSATAVFAGLAAQAQRVDISTQGNAAGGFFTGPNQPVRAYTASEFTVHGLDTATALTFYWRFEAARSWDINNAAYSVTMTASLTAPGFIDNLGWGISYVDGPPALGDFAGVLSNPFGTSMAGLGFSNVLPVGIWDGQGTRDASTTMDGAITGGTGSFALLLQSGIAGDVLSQHRLRLSGLTVADSTALAPLGAHLLLDDGSRIAITAAVPEPQAWALLAAGLGLLALRLRRRA